MSKENMHGEHTQDNSSSVIFEDFTFTEALKLAVRQNSFAPFHLCKKPPSERLFPALIGGVLGALLGGAIWAGFGIVSNYEFAVIAMLTGVLAGSGVIIIGRKQGIPFQLIAVITALLGIFVGRYWLYCHFAEEMFFSMETIGNFIDDLPNFSEAIDFLFYGLALISAFVIPSSSDKNIPSELLNDQKVTQFYRDTMAVWESGELSEIDSTFEQKGKETFGSFVRRHNPYKDSALSAFFTQFPPKPGEYLIRSASSWFVLTNLRLVQKDGKSKTFKEITLKDIDSYAIKGMDKKKFTFKMKSGDIVEFVDVKPNDIELRQIKKTLEQLGVVK